MTTTKEEAPVQAAANGAQNGASSAEVRTPAYQGPERRAPVPLRAYGKTVLNSESRLPPITGLGEGIVALAVNNMAPKELGVLALHLNHACREASINGSLSAAQRSEVAKGDYVQLVRVSTVSSSYEGAVGVVQKISKLRCYVKVRGKAQPLYVYLAEVERLTAAQYKKLAAQSPSSAEGRRSQERTSGPRRQQPRAKVA